MIFDKVLPIAVVPVSAMVEVLYRAVERGHAQPGSLSLGDGLCIAVAERLRLP